MKIKVKVMPNSSKEEVVQQDASEYIVRVRAPAQEGRANEAALRVLAAHFKVSRSSVRIVSGFSSKHKIIEVVTG